MRNTNGGSIKLYNGEVIGSLIKSYRHIKSTGILVDFFGMKQFTVIFFFLILNITYSNGKTIGYALSINFQDSAWQPVITENDNKHLKAAWKSLGFDLIKGHYGKLTKSDILKLIQEDLAKQLEAGDILHLHFSSHGEQVRDWNGDETDGKDEAIVCYDTPALDSLAKLDYNGSKHLIDDEIEVLLNDIRLKLGKDGHLLVSFDACYSHTINRDDYTEMRRGELVDPLIFNNQNLTYEIADSKREDSVMSEMVIISAVSGTETDYSGVTYATNDLNEQSVGSLTFAICRAITFAKSTVTYQELYEDITKRFKELNNLNKAWIEGDLYQSVLKGKTGSDRTVFEIIELQDGKFLRVNKGIIHGLLSGMSVNLISDYGFRGYEQLRIPAQVKRVDIDYAILELPDTYLNEIKETIRKFNFTIQADESNKILENNQVTIGIDTKNLEQELIKHIESIPFIRIDSNYFDVLIHRKGDSLFLEDYISKSQTGTTHHNNDIEQWLSDKLEQKVLARRLRRLYLNQELPNPKITIQANDSSFQDRVTVFGTLKLSFKDTCNLHLSITQSLQDSLYLNIVGVDKEDRVFVLTPSYWHISELTPLITKKNYLQRKLIWAGERLDIKFIFTPTYFDMRSYINNINSRSFKEALTFIHTTKNISNRETIIKSISLIPDN